MKWTKRKYDKGTVGYTSAKKGRFTYDLTDPKGNLLGFVLMSADGLFCASAWLGDRWKDLGIYADFEESKHAVEDHAYKGRS